MKIEIPLLYIVFFMSFHSISEANDQITNCDYLVANDSTTLSVSDNFTKVTLPKSSDSAVKNITDFGGSSNARNTGNANEKLLSILEQLRLSIPINPIYTIKSLKKKSILNNSVDVNSDIYREREFCKLLANCYESINQIETTQKDLSVNSRISFLKALVFCLDEMSKINSPSILNMQIESCIEMLVFESILALKDKLSINEIQDFVSLIQRCNGRYTVKVVANSLSDESALSDKVNLLKCNNVIELIVSNRLNIESIGYFSMENIDAVVSINGSNLLNATDTIEFSSVFCGIIYARYFDLVFTAYVANSTNSSRSDCYKRIIEQLDPDSITVLMAFSLYNKNLLETASKLSDKQSDLFSDKFSLRRINLINTKVFFSK